MSSWVLELQRISVGVGSRMWPNVAEGGAEKATTGEDDKSWGAKPCLGKEYLEGYSIKRGYVELEASPLQQSVTYF